MSAESPLPERIILTADIGIDRASYEALELAIRLILEDPSHSLTMRLLAVRSLVGAAVAEYGRGSKAVSSFSTWMDQMNGAAGRQWIYQDAANEALGRGSRQRLALAPMIAAVESSKSNGRLQELSPGISPVAKAVYVAKGVIRLDSLGGEVALERMACVQLDEASPTLSAALVGCLTGWVRARLLLSLPNLVKGARYLLLCAALTRWYAVAGAAMHGKEEVADLDLRSAADVVEREYIIGDRPRDLPTRHSLAAGLFDLLLDLLVSPRDLAHNPYLHGNHRLASSAP